MTGMSDILPENIKVTAVNQAVQFAQFWTHRDMSILELEQVVEMIYKFYTKQENGREQELR